MRPTCLLCSVCSVESPRVCVMACGAGVVAPASHFSERSASASDAASCVCSFCKAAVMAHVPGPRAGDLDEIPGLGLA